MRRRQVVLLELILLAGILVWLGLEVFGRDERPQGAIDLKVQLRGAEDRVWLLPDDRGVLRFRIRNDDGSLDWAEPAQFAARLYDDQNSRGFWEVLLNVSSPAGFVWVTLGLLGQVLFTGRMLVQWLVSEKNRRSTVPPAFWWMSLAGASMLLVYFVWRKEPIGVLGQATGWFIYVRNLLLIYRRHPHRTGPDGEATRLDPSAEFRSR